MDVDMKIKTILKQNCEKKMHINSFLLLHTQDMDPASGKNIQIMSQQNQWVTKTKKYTAS